MSPTLLAQRSPSAAGRSNRTEVGHDDQNGSKAQFFFPKRLLEAAGGEQATRRGPGRKGTVFFKDKQRTVPDKYCVGHARLSTREHAHRRLATSTGLFLHQAQQLTYPRNHS
jgi:hypothetical protein